LATAFPGKPEADIDASVRRHIETAADQEWPQMARQNATLTVVPKALAGALELAIALKPATIGQQVAQREIVAALERALDARRQRIILSQSTVNWAKWMAVIALAVLTLVAIALGHSDNRRSAAFAMSIFAAAVAVTIVVIASEDRPFSGPFRVTPNALLQVLPPKQ
jgi:cytochrome bd-type quinol oxidase subunit 2